MTTIIAVIFGMSITVSASLLLALKYNHRLQSVTNNLLKSFDDAAAEFNLSISKQEILSNRVIGFDHTNRKLLFLEETVNKPNGYLIDLEEIKSCTVKKIYNTRNTDNASRRKSEASVNAIALEFAYKNRTNPTALPFYDSASNRLLDMHERAQQAKKWEALLSTTLTEKTPLSRADHETTLGV